MTTDIDLRFFNLERAQFCTEQEIEKFRNDRLSDVNFENYERNCLQGFGDRSKWLPVFGGNVALYSGMRVDSACRGIVDEKFIPVQTDINFEKLLDICEASITNRKAKKIGVHLSGGLDSSIVIGILDELNIKFFLIGLVSDRYEFRTERRIQEELCAYHGDAHLIDEATVLPCGDLDHVPAHLYPDILSLNYNQESALAAACEKAGVDALFGGGGGDCLFGGAFSEVPSSNTIRPQTFSDHFSQKYAYRERGVRFCSFFEDPAIINAIYSLRRGQSDDRRKIWARKYFERVLPKKLVDYSYCADFWGRDIEGLSSNFEACLRQIKGAFIHTGHPFFNPEQFVKMYKNHGLKCDQRNHQILEARISAAVWVNAI